MSTGGAVLFAVAAVVVLALVQRLADRTGLPSAALLAVVGIAYGLAPGPDVVLDPELVLAVLLPPLLHAAALDSSLVAIRSELRVVVSLSVALVVVTALAVGAGVSLVVAGAGTAAATALGAAVAPPDPVAALAVGRRVGLPRRILTLVQGEGLLNDATALTLLSVAVTAAAGGGFSVGTTAGRFALSTVGGVAVGVALALLLRQVRRVVHDPLVAAAISLATPFAAYQAGEALHASGVLAVVVTALVVGHQLPRTSSAPVRLQVGAVWRLVDFLLQGAVFLLVGMQVPEVVTGLSRYPAGTVVAAAAVTLGAVLLVRPAWLVLTQLLPGALRTRLGGAQEAEDDEQADPAHRPHRPRELPLSWRELVVLSWTGTRGVVTLAAVSTLPRTLEDGSPFPARDLLVFCAYLVVLVTLVGQGATFAPLVRRLGVLADQAQTARVRNEARLAAARVALDALEDAATELEVPDEVAAEVRDRLQRRTEVLEHRADALSDAEPGEQVPVSPRTAAVGRLTAGLIDVQRDELVRWRDAGRLSDEGLRELEAELDRREDLLPPGVRP